MRKSRARKQSLEFDKFVNWWNKFTPAEKERTLKHADLIPESKVHYIDIPQSLKDTAVRKGFPLFSTGLVFTPVDHDPFQDQEVLNGNAT
jgi:hypothetical protein